MGSVFDNSVFSPNTDGNLQLNIGLSDDSLLPDKVVYVTSTPPGDFVADGDRYVADLLKWQQDALGATALDAWLAGYGVRPRLSRQLPMRCLSQVAHWYERFLQ
ncbi:hypothetical protein [Adhaeretor mobilis]|uniref:Uncharacterized protein n=1 Tax=Adhaeretor mobilis TaxID=1930276 RepID=A0A517N1M6_9BACT|nr:hypothetical protein [Adhaeretor mobilis]QDT00908.1 hypothetical protein HG15A2_42500 [Adhaeretor mobilis]